MKKTIYRLFPLATLAISICAFAAPAQATVLNITIQFDSRDSATGWLDVGKNTNPGLSSGVISYSLTLNGHNLFGADSGRTVSGTMKTNYTGDSLCLDSSNNISPCKFSPGLNYDTVFNITHGAQTHAHLDINYMAGSGWSTGWIDSNGLTNGLSIGTPKFTTTIKPPSP